MNTEDTTPEETEDTTGYATYCPEDDKIRLYAVRVPKDEYLALRKQGWTATPKQECDFVAVWTKGREDTAIEYSGGTLEDEDQSPADRAADRAERFSGYREKRREESLQLADKYEAGPQIHGYQSEALATRRAARHDMQGTRAVNQWDKASYWQDRTAGVISNALHKAAPGVRFGRIKKIEAEIRALEKGDKEYNEIRDIWVKVFNEPDAEKATRRALFAERYDGGWSYCYKHPRPVDGMPKHYLTGTSLNTLVSSEEFPITGHEAAEMYLARNPERKEEGRTLRHSRLRLEYETQMLEAQGGRAADVDMVPGGFIGSYQIQQVHKSPATGRVVSVSFLAPTTFPHDRKGKAYGDDNPRPIVSHKITVERMKRDVYRAPTPEELQAFEDEKKAAKKEKAKGPKGPALINLTDEDAERMQAIWNKQNRKDEEVVRLTQAQYSAASKGGYARHDTAGITASGRRFEQRGYNPVSMPIVAKVRSQWWHVIVITDKPQKPLPAEMWIDPIPALKAATLERLEELVKIVQKGWIEELNDEEEKLFTDARICGFAHHGNSRSLSEEASNIARERGLYAKRD